MTLISFPVAIRGKPSLLWDLFLRDALAATVLLTTWEISFGLSSLGSSTAVGFTVSFLAALITVLLIA